ncbi:MAG: glycosyltransferase family 4 protein [Bacteroidota bacterium]|nr:glycosyltransferase family 4 protein [Candidatus Kapabacteria bacterium]MDW8221166.1 glycosyltransferase family 4 protein [Bacteroidota bacterium]
MTIALAHNYYQHRGGEDTVFETEGTLLEQHGHRVLRYTMHNDTVQQYSAISLASRTVWNRDSYARLLALFQQERPDILHCHNTLPLLSPSVYAAARAAGIPVIQTLHNYRLLCPNALFFRNGHVCEDCLGKKVALPAILHRCYRGSIAASALVTATTALHHFIGTWEHAIDRYIVLTEFARAKFIEGGLPQEKIVVKPNCVAIDPGFQTAQHTMPNALYVGRLSEEKGVMLALEAWHILQSRNVPISLYIIGDGPLEPNVREYIRVHQLRTVHLLGRRALHDVLQSMKAARCVIFPSLLYETFGKAMIEAFACGTPVIASRLGALQEIVSDGITGYLFERGNAISLADAVQHMYSLPDEQYAAMRSAARFEYEHHYTAEATVRALERIYEECIAQRSLRH